MKFVENNNNITLLKIAEPLDRNSSLKSQGYSSEPFKIL